MTSFETKEVAECDREYKPVLNIPTNKTSQHSDNIPVQEEECDKQHERKGSVQLCEYRVQNLCWRYKDARIPVFWHITLCGG